MSRFLIKKPKNMKKIMVENQNIYCSDNILLSLGLSKNYIKKNNYIFFGKENIENQNLIKEKFVNIEKQFENFFNYILKIYDTETLVLELGTIYTKLQDIYLANDIVLMKKIKINFNKISYTARAAELMRRKLKNLIEIIILKDNRKKTLKFSNKDYKKVIIFLYYYSIYKFYSVRNAFSEGLENGITEFLIRPKNLNCITTYIKNMPEQKTCDVRYNYKSNVDFYIDKKFDNAFFNDKGIMFNDYIKLMDNLLALLNSKSLYNAKLKIEKFNDYLKNNFSNLDIEKFNKNCILTKDSFEYDEKSLYKNTCKHRLDTTPIILLDNYYIINKGIIWYSKNFWNNVQLLGLTPYVSTEKDIILNTVEKIVKRISDDLEKDIIKIFKELFISIEVFHNKKTRQIFNNRELEENEWDILITEHDKKYIFDIEAKYITTSMTESALSNDLAKVVANNSKSYQNKFQKRINIEKQNINDFLSFCNADNSYKIIHIMVISKNVDLDIISENREFIIINFSDLKQYLKENF